MRPPMTGLCSDFLSLQNGNRTLVKYNSLPSLKPPFITRIARENPKLMIIFVFFSYYCFQCIECRKRSTYRECHH